MRLLSALGALFISGLVSATPLHNVVIFGDSLSDNGNLYEVMKHQLPQNPPYYEGRFSNGPVWIEHLVESYFPGNAAAHLFDYAYGGAGIAMDDSDDDVLFTLKREINTYLLAHQDKAEEDSLFVVWIGANNYLGMPSDAQDTLNLVNAGVTNGLKLLVEKGAKHILVLNLPDLGRSPAAFEFGSTTEMSYFSQQHNLALAATVDQLKQSYPQVDFVYFDMYSALNQVLDNPEQYGFTNITNSCYNTVLTDLKKNPVLSMAASLKSTSEMNPCEGYMFFDLVHPTAKAHKILAEKARLKLDEAGIEMTE